MTGMEHYDYTRRMERLVTEAADSIAVFCSREDVEEAREAVLTAQPSALIWRREELRKLCEPLGIDMQRLLQDESELLKIPVRSELKAQMAQIMYDMYREFPTSSDYMKRLVAWLAPECAAEPLRLAILKKFLRGSLHEGALFAAEGIYDWAWQRLPAELRQEKQELSVRARKEFLIDTLDDDVFDLMDVRLSRLELTTLMAKRLRRSLHGDDRCFVRNPDGSMGVVTDMCLSDETAAAVHDFLDRHMTGAHPEMMLECVEAVVAICSGEDMTPQQAEAELSEFFDGLQRDFRSQVAGVAYMRRDAGDILARKRGEYAAEAVKLCREAKFGVRTDETVLRLFLLALWDDRQEQIKACSGFFEAGPDEVFGEGFKKALEDAIVSGVIDVNCLEKTWRSMINRLLKVFSKYVRQAVSGMSDPLQEKCKTDRKDALKQKKRVGRVDPVLEICDDLAGGLFRKNGISKEYLYYFAFMFDMQVAFDGAAADPRRDVAKNLFHDYYSDNLMRYLQAEYSDPALLTNLEKEPTGEGINYKNYVEAIYLYYLARTDLADTPGERLDRAVAKIAQCTRRGRKESKSGAVYDVSGATNVYRFDRMQTLLSLPEDQVEEYICTHYLIVPPVAVSQIMVNSDEMTAVENVREIMEWLEEAFDHNTLIEQTVQINRFGTGIISVAKQDDWDEIKSDGVYAKNMKFGWELSKLLREKFGQDADFMHLVDALEKRLDTAKHPGLVAEMYKNPLAAASKDSNKNFAVLQAALPEAEAAENKRITRSGMIALYANYYKTMLDDMEGTSSAINNFSELYEDFCASIDPLLEESRYQPISMKNMLDVYTVFTLCFYVLGRFE